MCEQIEKIVPLKLPKEEYLNLLDPYKNEQITFSRCVDLFSNVF